MDTVDASHFEQIKKYAEANPGHMFQMRKHLGHWYMQMFDIHNPEESVISVADPSFAMAIKYMSTTLAGGSNGGTSNSTD